VLLASAPLIRVLLASAPLKRVLLQLLPSHVSCWPLHVTFSDTVVFIIHLSLPPHHSFS
jgi:hypothetical protein